jgi:hypothetical protein
MFLNKKLVIKLGFSTVRSETMKCISVLRVIGALKAYLEFAAILDMGPLAH